MSSRHLHLDKNLILSVKVTSGVRASALIESMDEHEAFAVSEAYLEACQNAVAIADYEAEFDADAELEACLAAVAIAEYEAEAELEAYALAESMAEDEAIAISESPIGSLPDG